MLTPEEIEYLISAHKDRYFDSYEDFTLNDHFEMIKSNFGHKSSNYFEDHFYQLDSLYNQHTGQSYTFDLYIKEFKSIKNDLNFNHDDAVRDMIYSCNRMQNLFNVLNRLSSASILEDLSVNYNGWISVASNYDVDITPQLKKIDKVLKEIKKDNVFDEIIEKIEKIQLSLIAFEESFRLVEDVPFVMNVPEYTESCFNLRRSVSLMDKYYEKYNNLNDIIKESNIFKHLEDYKKIRKEIINTLVENEPNFHYSHAHRFSKKMKEASDVELMLLARDDTGLDSVHYVKRSIKFDNKGSNVNQIKIFEDRSIAVEKATGGWVDLSSKKVKNALIEDLICKELAFKLRKSPTVSKMFVKKLKEDFDECERAFTAANTYVDNEAILKSKQYNLLEEIDDLLFEDLDDSMNEFIRDRKIVQYGLSIASNKYRHLYNEDSFGNIILLYDLKIPASELQESLGKKMASFKTSDDFNKALRQLYAIHSGFNNDIISQKAVDANAEIIQNDTDRVILKIETFEQSSKLGSASWCIVRDNVHFNSYKEDCHQYFIYDFTKDATDDRSIIGVTLRQDGRHSAAHFKNDSQFHDDDDFKLLQLDILKHDLKSYPNLHESLKNKLEVPERKQNILKNLASKFFNR